MIEPDSREVIEPDSREVSRSFENRPSLAQTPFTRLPLRVRLATSPVLTTVIMFSAVLVTFGVSFPSATRWFFALLFGSLSWSVGILFHTWNIFFRFLLAVLIATAALVTVCAVRAWLDVRWITNVAPWNIGPRRAHAKSLSKDTLAVVSAILFELIFPIFLMFMFIILAFSMATLLLPNGFTTVQHALSNIATDLGDGLRIDTSSVNALVSSIQHNFNDITSVLTYTFDKSAAVVGGVVSAFGSLLIFLFKRRQSTVSTARVLLNEITTIIKSTVESTPQSLAKKDSIIKLPKGVRVISAGADRELLLLGPTTAAKLPTCLLANVVRFFHVDFALSQVFASVGSEAFAQATASRRADYLSAYEGIWLTEYQPAAFSVLFRLALYARLRAWTI